MFSFILGLSPESNTVPVTCVAPTSTTFSLPYYHSIYSHSQPTVAESKKVHAPTFTPEIGTLPSVIAMTTMPVQTSACDMRIKKEKGSYSCCKDTCTTSVSLCLSKQPCSSPSKPGHDKREVTRQSKRGSDGKDTKSKKTSSKLSESEDKNIQSTSDTSALSLLHASVSPVSQTKPKCDSAPISVSTVENTAETVKSTPTKEQLVMPIRVCEGTSEAHPHEDPKTIVKGLVAIVEVNGSKRVPDNDTTCSRTPKTFSDKDSPITFVKVSQQCGVSEEDGRTCVTKTEGTVKPITRDSQHCKPIKSKLPEKGIRSRETRRKYDGHGKDDNPCITGTDYNYSTLYLLLSL